MKRIWLKIGFVIAALLTLFFVIRLALFALWWLDPNKALHPVEPWMTPRYIIRTYDISRDQLAEALLLEPGDSPRAPLGKLARDRGVTVAQLVQAVQALLDQRPAPQMPPAQTPEAPEAGINPPVKP